MSKSKPNSLAKKPLRAAAAEISAPEITVKATYTSAIGIDVHLNLLVCTVPRHRILKLFLLLSQGRHDRGG